MFPRTMVWWGIGLAAGLLSASSAYGGEYQIDTWQFTPSVDTEYKVDIYGVRPPTLSKPYPTWVLLHDDHSCRYAGDVPEFGYHRWHLNVIGHCPGVVEVYGIVYCRTNGCTWQSLGQITGETRPGWREGTPGENEVASIDGPVSALSSVAVRDGSP